jgi:hypothetical protein
MALRSTQPLTEKCTRNLPAGKKRPARRSDNFAVMSRMSENVGVSTCHNPKGLHGLYRDNFTLLLVALKCNCILPMTIRLDKKTSSGIL